MHQANNTLKALYFQEITVHHKYSTGFYRLDALPVIQPTVSKHSSKLEALTSAKTNSSVVLSFLYPPLDS